jgi:transcription antitermination protein NusB
MKTSSDPRHQKRVKLVQELFANDFKKQGRYVTEIWSNLDKIDPEIVEAAPEWPLEKLNKIDLAILRLAVYELIIDKSVPYKVIIDEAVELAKEFGGSAAPDFINGVLGYIVKKYEA